MLKQDELHVPTNQELHDAWLNWCDDLTKLPQFQMKKNDTEAMLMLCIAEMEATETPKQIADSFPFKVMKARAESLGLKASDPLLAFFSIQMARGIVGSVVMYTHVLRYVQLKKDLPELTMNNVFFHVFGDGFPDAVGMESIWKKQKGQYLGWKCDNMIDRVNAEIAEMK